MTISSGLELIEARCDLSDSQRASSHRPVAPPRVATSDNADLAPEVSPILDALEQFAQFMDEIYDGPKPHPAAWEGNPSRVASRSVGRVLCKWRHAVKPNRPPSALVVRLARKLPSVLTDVAERPKRILQRRRGMEPLNRLRELDSTCARWLTRQPGLTLAEKSGHRRSILAVQRFESVDTLENRVVRDLLHRCTDLARSYLRQHQSRFSNHPWIQMTAKFLSLCGRLESLPHLRDVAGLPSLPKPNYVLLHESRYQQVWQAYSEVIRQQRRRQQLWTWRHRAFADMVIVAMMNSSSHVQGTPYDRKEAHRCDLLIRETPLRGQFFDWRSPPPFWRLGPERFFFVGPAELRHYWRNDCSEGGSTEDAIQVCLVNRSDSLLAIYEVAIQFADDHDDNSFRDTISNDQAKLCIRPVNSGSSGQQLLVPLTLLSSPNALDEFIQSGWSR